MSAAILLIGLATCGVFALCDRNRHRLEPRRIDYLRWPEYEPHPNVAHWTRFG